MNNIKDLTRQEALDLIDEIHPNDIFRKDHQEVMNVAFWDTDSSQKEELKLLVYGSLPLDWQEHVECLEVNPYSLLNVYRLFWKLGETEKLEKLYSDIKVWCLNSGFEV